MISSLTGTVTHLGLENLVLDVNGFGMLIHAPTRTLTNLRLKQETTILTSMIVREDSMTLYGFSDPADREVFETLLSVSGIGPRIALAVLGVHTAHEVEQAVSTGDDKAFSKVPGIGPKGARRIVLELAGKLILGDDQAKSASSQTEAAAWKPQVLDAMMGLGWSEKDASAAIDSYVSANPQIATASLAQALKAVLASLGSGQTTTRY